MTKNELYRLLLRQCADNGLPFSHVVNDAWFASSENMMFARHKLGRHFVMPLMANRRVALSQGTRPRALSLFCDAVFR